MEIINVAAQRRLRRQKVAVFKAPYPMRKPHLTEMWNGPGLAKEKEPESERDRLKRMQIETAKRRRGG